MKNVAIKSAFQLSDNPAVQAGIVTKPSIKALAMPEHVLTDSEVHKHVSLAISAAKRSATAVQKALQYTVMHAQATGDIRPIGRLVNGLGSVINMRGVLGFLEQFAPAQIETKGKGYAVIYDEAKRWTNDDYATNNSESALMLTLTKSYLDFQPATQDAPFNADKAIVNAAVKIANRVNDPHKGDYLDIEHCRKLLEFAINLTDNEKQISVIVMALDNLDNDEAIIGALENDLATDTSGDAVPMLLQVHAG